MNLDYFQTYLAVVDTGSFHAAAKARGLTQSAVSQQIRRLEDHFEAPLLQRSRSGCRPTPLGARLRPRAEALLRFAERALTLEEPAALAVAASTNIGTYILQTSLQRFRLAYPGVAVDSRLLTNPEVEQALVEGVCDLGFMEWPSRHRELEVSPWRHERLVAIFPPEHRFRTRAALTMTDLASERLLGGERATGTGALLRQHFGPLVERLNVAENLGSTAAVIAAVRAGAGVSIVFESSAYDAHKAGTIGLCSIEPALTKALWTAEPRGHSNRRVRDFVALCGLSAGSGRSLLSGDSAVGTAAEKLTTES